MSSRECPDPKPGAPRQRVPQCPCVVLLGGAPEREPQWAIVLEESPPVFPLLTLISSWAVQISRHMEGAVINKGCVEGDGGLDLDPSALKHTTAD